MQFLRLVFVTVLLETGFLRTIPAEATGNGNIRNNSSLYSIGMRLNRDKFALSNFVIFLAGKTTRQQFYIIFDNSVPGTDNAIRELSHHGTDMVLFEYQNLTFPTPLLDELLTPKIHMEHWRHVLVICAKHNVEKIFQQVSMRSLESPSLRWMVISDQPITEGLQHLLREGSQVVVAEGGARGALDHTSSFDLLGTRITPQDDVRFERLGWWRDVMGVRDSRVPKDLFPDLKDLYEDFEGRVLRVSVVDNWPFFAIRSLEEDGSYLPDGGVDNNILDTLAEVLNFTYEIVVPSDGQWGGPQPDGSVIGMIGNVARHEAHIAINEITITNARDSVVDFTYPYFLETTVMVSRAPKQKSRALAVFAPFSLEVWIALLLVTLFIGPVTYALALLVHEDPETSQGRPPLASSHHLLEFTFNAFRCLVYQDDRLKIKPWPLRSAFFCWYFFCFCVYALYAGTLTAFLVKPVFEKPIDSLADLLHAAKTNDFYGGFIEDTSPQYLFEEATSGLYKELQDIAFSRPEGKVVDNPEGLQKVLKEKYVYIQARMGAEIHMMKIGRSRFHTGRDSFYPQGYGVVCRSGSPFREKMDEVLIRLTEAGLIYMWARQEIERLGTSVSISEDSSSAEEGPNSGEGPQAIGLSQLQAAFFIMFVGIFTAFLALLGEKALGTYVVWG